MAHAVIMPKAGMSMETGTILKWLKAPGDRVRRGEALLEIETDKVAMEVEAETDGVLLSVTHGPGETVPVTQVIGYIGEPGEVPPSAAPPTASAAPAAPAPAPAAPHPSISPLAARVPVRASPLARTIARQRGLDLGTIRGSGPGGAVRARDLPLRTAATGATMEAPTVTLHADADLTELEELLRRLNEQGSLQISLTAFLLRAAASGCREHPLLRSSLDGETIVTEQDVNLGVAVPVEGGLIAAVIRRADTLTPSALADKVAELSLKAREHRLSPEETNGAVFIVTNLGELGVRNFDPLLLPRQTAILGAGAVRDHLSLQAGQVTARRLADLALTFDRRLLDEVEAAVALRTVREALEFPLSMLV